MNRRFFLVGVGALAAASPFPAKVFADQWVLLGTRHVNWLVDTDIFDVGAGMGQFDHIQLRVRGNGLFVYDLDVVYGNGGHDDIPLRFHIPEGGSTRSIDLRGGDRNIRRVKIVYQKPVDGGGPTWVELWGQR
jgi:hypothetical protein